MKYLGPADSIAFDVDESGEPKRWYRPGEDLTGVSAKAVAAAVAQGHTFDPMPGSEAVAKAVAANIAAVAETNAQMAASQEVTEPSTEESAEGRRAARSSEEDTSNE